MLRCGAAGGAGAGETHDFCLQPVNESVKASIRGYIRYRLRPGGFLEALLAGDVQLAAACADAHNAKHLNDVVRYVQRTVPPKLRGSFAAVLKHCKLRS